jgi:hypothetical protein
MKYALFSLLVLGVNILPTPALAQFSSFPASTDSCSSFCVKLDLGSANNDSSFNSGFGSGFNSSPSSGSNNLRWQVGVTWRPNPPEFSQLEADRTKQRLEDNRSLMTSLADAIAQNKTELARGLAILLAPRLNYRDPLILLAEMKQGSMNIGSASIDRKPPTPNSSLAPTTPMPKDATSNVDSTPVIEIR